VEADVYAALRRRIGLFGTFVGKLQPILSKLPARIAEAALAGGDPELARRAAVNEIEAEAAHAEAEGFDLDAIAPADLEEPVRPAALYDLAFLDELLARPDLLPPGVEAKPLHGSPRQFSYTAPGLGTAVRVTTDPEVFDEHPESVELWSPGSPLFPQPDETASREEVAAAGADLAEALERAVGAPQGAGQRREEAAMAKPGKEPASA
jgi:hypothetical protein